MAKKVLMIDDDEGFLLAAGRLLEAAGYEVARATGADQAGTQLEADLPDLILLDVIMPGKDGFAFADEIAKDERLAGIPIVLVTAVAENAGQMMHAFEENAGLPACDILPKSAAHTQLVDTVAAALGKA